jgi:hydrogenase large subunit
LLRDLLRQSGGSNVYARIIGRLVELARITLAMEQWARALRLKEPFCTHEKPCDEGHSLGLIEAARGSLGHWMSVKKGKIERYQIIAPTTWNFSPRDAEGQPGPAEAALAGTDVGAHGSKSPAIQHIIRSFDPCMVCTAH